MASPSGSISALPLPPPRGRVALISQWNPGSCTLLWGHCGGAQASAGLAQSRFKLNWLIAKCFCCLPAWFFFFFFFKILDAEQNTKQNNKKNFIIEKFKTRKQ